MTQNTTNNAYTIIEATQKERDEVVALTNTKLTDKHIVYVALDPTDVVIGWIVAKTETLTNDSWFITLMRVKEPYKRQHIGTTLFEAMRKKAEICGVTDLHGFANPTEEASMFWRSLGFCHVKTGPVNQTVRRFGNYMHYIFRNPVERSALLDSPTDTSDITIAPATEEQFEQIYAESLHSYNPTYFEGVKADLFGFAATDPSGKIVGFALMKHEPMYPPYTDMMLLFWLYVEPAFRRQKIGTMLARAVADFAKERRIPQLFHAGLDDEKPFYDALRFHTHVHGKSAKEPEKNVIFAAARID